MFKMMLPKRKKHLSSFQIIIFGFVAVILAGSLFLMLPAATIDGKSASFADSVFTATSAVCVTGLVVQDTATYWSFFGQFIILLLIQVGGMGVITVAVLLTIVSGRKIGLMQRSTLQEAIAAPHLGGIVRLTWFIMRGTFLIESIGAIVMAPVFVKDYGPKGIWYAIFHSISAFCNAGFDLMGVNQQFSSLTKYVTHPVINITVMLLIIIGGIGFLTWEDIVIKRKQFGKYRMQSKVILTVTAFLILIPTVYFYFCEFANLPAAERFWSSLFQSVTPRTAGFNTADLTTLTETGAAIVIILMLIGGSPGSTAGGMKTTTIAVLFASARAVFKSREDTCMYGRRIAPRVISTAACILLMYLILFLGGGLVISRIEALPLLDCLFETASAIGTVGLTMGITPDLSMASRTILIFLMFIGRVGGLTLIFATISGTKLQVSRFPQEKITVG